VVYGRCEASGDAHRYRRGADRDGAGQRAGVAAVSVGGGDMKPRCKLCLERHWSYESHVFSAEIRTPKPWPKQPLSPAGVTKIDISTTPTVTKMGRGRPKRYENAAARQRAYRRRRGAI